MKISFSKKFEAIDLQGLSEASVKAEPSDVKRILNTGIANSLEDFARLLSPAAEPYLETMCRLSQGATLKHFGKTIRMFLFEKKLFCFFFFAKKC